MALVPRCSWRKLGDGAGGRSRGFIMITSPVLAAGVARTIIVSAKPYIYMTEKKLV